MESIKWLITPALVVVLISAAAITSRWASDRRTATRVGTGTSWSSLRIEPRTEPIAYRFLYPNEAGAVEGRLTFARVVEGRVREVAVWSFGSFDEWYEWAPTFFADEEGWTPRLQPGWLISRWLNADEPAVFTCGQLFWRIQALRFLDPGSFANEIEWIEASGKTVEIRTIREWPCYDYDSDTLYWNPSAAEYVPKDGSLRREWFKATPLVTLAYALSHAHYDLCRDGDRAGFEARETFAVTDENHIRHILFLKDPACSQIRPRPGYRETWPDLLGDSAEKAWWEYRGAVEY